MLFSDSKMTMLCLVLSVGTHSSVRPAIGVVPGLLAIMNHEECLVLPALLQTQH